MKNNLANLSVSYLKQRKCLPHRYSFLEIHYAFLEIHQLKVFALVWTYLFHKCSLCWVQAV